MTFSNDDDDSSMNEPDLQRVAYEVAIETMVKIYQDFRKGGLSRRDSATIIAQLISAGDIEEPTHD